MIKHNQYQLLYIKYLYDVALLLTGVIVTKFGSSRLITGGASRQLRLWSVHGMGELRLTAGYANR